MLQDREHRYLDFLHLCDNRSYISIVQSSKIAIHDTKNDETILESCRCLWSIFSYRVTSHCGQNVFADLYSALWYMICKCVIMWRHTYLTQTCITINHYREKTDVFNMVQYLYINYIMCIIWFHHQIWSNI